MNTADNIAYYNDDQIADWLKRFLESPSDVLVISDIPFSYTEVRDEYIRREHERDYS